MLVVEIEVLVVVVDEVVMKQKMKTSTKPIQTSSRITPGCRLH